MQLQHLKDFIFRRTTWSDRDEVLALIRKQGNPLVALALETEFSTCVQDAGLIFETILNSNGVVIGFVYATSSHLKELAINSNFLKTELKTVLFQKLSEWALKQGGIVGFERDLISEDRESFFRKHKNYVIKARNSQ